MAQNTYKILKWDSDFFGYKICELYTNFNQTDVLRNILRKMKSENFKLIYWCVDPSDTCTNQAAKSICAKLVDKKVTYIKEILNKESFSIDLNIFSYSKSSVSDKLKLLAIQSGIYSRFRLDDNFINNEFERLYAAWIENSVSGKIAKDVLVYNENQDELGFITLGIKNNRGDIGLIAVDKGSRGKSIGKKLVLAGLYKFKAWHMNMAQVVTQQANQSACRFYESLCFKVEKIENIYHIWL